jgi:hypothetical protein
VGAIVKAGGAAGFLVEFGRDGPGPLSSSIEEKDVCIATLYPVLEDILG